MFPTLVGPMGPPGGPGTYVESLAALRLLDATVFTQGYVVNVGGYATWGDGGGGLFLYQPASATADNDGTIVSPANAIGRWFRIFNGAINVQWFGALPASAATDVTTKFQNALNTGKNAYVPASSDYYKVSVTLTLTAPGQKVFGDGYLSKVVQTGTNANSTVFYASALGYNHFDGLYAIPGTTTASLYDGYGFKFSACDNSSANNCYVTGSRRGGIAIFDCDNCKILKNWIMDSVVAPPVQANATGFDIYVAGASSYNLVDGNYCGRTSSASTLNGCGIGIAVQTLVNGDQANHNVISNNIINNQDLYGIMLYLNNVASSIQHTIIEGNDIDTVTGNIAEFPSGLFNYGAGIYVQTALHTLITGNQIKNTNVHTPQDVQQAPAAIGISDSAGCVITSNKIYDAKYHGIFCIYGSAFTTSYIGAIIADNDILNANQSGIFLQDWPSAQVHDNRIYGYNTTNASNRGGYGIRIRQVSGAFAAQCDDFNVHHNRITHTIHGLFCEGVVNRLIADRNIIKDTSDVGYGIYSSAAYVEATGNDIITASGGTGIVFLSTCVEGFASYNRIEVGTGIGIQQNTNSSVLVDPALNSISATTPYSTWTLTTSYFRPLANIQNPSVKNALYVSQANVIGITNFDDGKQGQRLILKALAAVTITDGATISVAGGANFVMASGDQWQGYLDGTVWREIARSVN